MTCIEGQGCGVNGGQEQPVYYFPGPQIINRSNKADCKKLLRKATKNETINDTSKYHSETILQ